MENQAAELMLRTERKAGMLLAPVKPCGGDRLREGERMVRGIV